MKQLILFIFLVVSFLFQACNTSHTKKEITPDLINNPATAQKDGKSDKNVLPQITFDNKDFDFGLIMQGEQVVHKYKFKNTGNADLIIFNVAANCGCTIPTYSKDPIAPGEEGYVEVAFDSEGRGGLQNKTVTVLANTQPNRIELTFTADIEVPNN